jgi:tetratricopeptide (TPR) repeat protein
LLGIAGTTAGLVRADAARRDAEAAQQAEADERQLAETARAEAEANLATVEAVVGFIDKRVIAPARPKGVEGGLGPDVTLRDAVVASLPALDTEFAGQPRVEARLREALGDTFYYLADARAIEQYQRSLALFTDLHGPDHPDTIRLTSSLGDAYDEFDRPADAIKCYEEVLIRRRRTLGPDHPSTLASAHGLGEWYKAERRPADALRCYEEATAGRRRTLGPDDTDTLWSMVGAAWALVELNRGSEALPLIDECRVRLPGKADRRRVNQYFMGPDGKWAVLEGEYDDTIRLMDRVFDLRLRHFQRAADSDGCRATAEMWEKLSHPGANSLYNAACFRAVAAELYGKANQPAEASADADRAMAWLTKAVAAGYRDRPHMDTDADLDALRGRAEFRALLATVPYPAPPPRPVR